uniref:PSP proline-rich domain-containing protein n=1 Tax=Arcella intermedia TaxID=1963864 RepID=A0A6B2L473_9EUKA
MENLDLQEELVEEGEVPVEEEHLLHNQLIDSLKAENKRLKDKVRFYAYGKDQKKKDNALCCITWQNISSEDRYEIEKILQRSRTRTETSEEPTLKPSLINDENYDGHGDLSKIHGFPGTVQYYKGWNIDLASTPVNLETLKTSKGWEAPKYIKMVVNKENGGSPKKKTKCFNCEGGHALKNCPKPKDHEAIRKRRLEFEMAKEKRCSETRYWEEEFQPGNLSQLLKDALGMKSNDKPPWYQNMLKNGYPPGYLVEKHEKNSTVNWLEDNTVENPTPQTTDKSQKTILIPLVNYPNIDNTQLLKIYQRKHGDPSVIISGLSKDSLTSKKRKRSSASDMEFSEEDLPRSEIYSASTPTIPVPDPTSPAPASSSPGAVPTHPSTDSILAEPQNTQELKKWPVYYVGMCPEEIPRNYLYEKLKGILKSAR